MILPVPLKLFGKESFVTMNSSTLPDFPSIPPRQFFAKRTSYSFHWQTLWSFLMVWALFSGNLPTWAQQPNWENSNFDRRQTVPQFRDLDIPPSDAQRQALARLRNELNGSLTETIDPTTGVTRTLSNPVGYLTEARAGDPADIALEFVQSNLELLGLQPGDMGEFEITDLVMSTPTEATHVYLRQKHQEIPVYNGQLQVHVNRDGRILSITNAFLPGLGSSLRSREAAIDAPQAVSSAARHLNIQVDTPPRTSGQSLGPQRVTPVVADQISRKPIQAELMWLPVGQAPHLVWRFQIFSRDNQHIYDITVDAEPGPPAIDGGRVFTRFDWVSQDSYRVYSFPVESPNHQTPLPPSDSRTLETDPWDQTASQLGWHDTGSTSFAIMRGNNVHAYHDRDGNNLPPSSEPDCGVDLSCDFSLDLTIDPVNYTDAAVANLFYWNNLIHDIQYQYGFDEEAGNFQVNNFGRGGLGNDDVQAEAQDGGDINNARFSTAPDGQRARMQMYLWNLTSPQRDGDFDNGIIVHEYGHGISHRQVGGPSTVSCLSNPQQPGEGWSDWLALVYTAKPGDQGADGRGIGTYALGQPTTGSGIRTQRYSTNQSINNHTYESITGMAIPHGVGEVWAQALWEMYWALVDEHGFDANLYTPLVGAGNHRALLYVNEGFKNTACSPTFVDARDGIIQAAVDSFGGEDVCLLWEAFAAFGLGTDAVSGGSNSTNPTNGFSVPASCGGTTTEPVCEANPIDFENFPLEAYSNQDGTGTVNVENSGDTLFMVGNRWRRSTQSFQVTSATVLEFQFKSNSEGEIHGIGFDEDQTLTNNERIFQFWGSQNWSSANQFTPRYSGSGDFEEFSIPVGEFYTGDSMRLVFVNDKDSGTLNNHGRFACVRLTSGSVPPTITAQPADVTVTAPNSATFSVTATGSPPLTYQWRKNETPIGGATNSTYTLNSTTTADSGAQFDVVVSNAEGSVTSNPATLTVLEEVVVAWEASGQNPGGSWSNSGWANRSFRVLLNGASISTSGSPVQLTLRGRSSGSYRVERVSLVQRDGSTLNGVDSTHQEVTFGGTWADGVTVPAGGSVISDPIPFDLEAGQDVFVTYWVPSEQPTVYRNGGSSTSAWTISGSDQSGTIDWGNLSISETRTHVYMVTQVDVVPAGGTPPSITTQPADVTVTAPNPATFNVTATGDAPLSYQWLRDGGNISGATSASYTLDPTSSSDTGATFSVVVSNAAGSESSSAATLTVQTAGSAPTIVTQPGDVTVPAPNPATFSVTATGSPPPTYQWRRDGVNIAGATSASYTLDPTTLGDSGVEFDVVVSNAEGTVTSNPATLTVLEEAVVAWEASAQNSGGSWSNSSWENRSFRVLLKGGSITTSGSPVQLTLRGRNSGSYTVERVSVVQREGSTLNGVNSTHQEVTFGGSWEAGVTVPAGGSVTSDPIPFDLEAGQDVFVTYWVPPGQPTVYRNGGSSTSAWTISDSDQSGTIDWGSLSFTETRSHVYLAESVSVIPTGGNPTTYRVNFQPNGATVPSGYLKDTGAVYTSTRGYGWDIALDNRDRNSVSDQRLDTFVFSRGATWQFDIPNGDYLVSLASGDADYTQGPHEVVVEGTTVFDNLPAAAGEFLTATDVPITVSDGQLTIDLSPTGTGLTMLNYVIINEVDTGGGP